MEESLIDYFNSQGINISKNHKVSGNFNKEISKYPINFYILETKQIQFDESNSKDNENKLNNPQKLLNDILFNQITYKNLNFNFNNNINNNLVEIQKSNKLTIAILIDPEYIIKCEE
jgi:hypothetical protein